MAQTRDEEGTTVRNQRGNSRGAAAAWKKVSLPSGSSVRHGAVSRMHVEPLIFRVFLPRDSAPRVYHAASRTRTRSFTGTEWNPTSRLRSTLVHRSIGGRDVRRSEIAFSIGRVRISIVLHAHYSRNIRGNFPGKRTYKRRGRVSAEG